MRRSGYHVLVAVPTRGAIRHETVTALGALRDATPGLRPVLYQPGNLSVALTRNKIVKRFWETDCEVLVMVDDDIVPPPHLLEAVVPHLPEFGMVSVPHPMLTPTNDEIVMSAFVENALGQLVVAPLDFGLNEVDAVATGCVAISREALETVGPNPFRIEANPDAEVTSDDFLFCADLRAAGVKVGAWWDGYHCDHVRTVQLAPMAEKTRSLA